jgi:organic radical activating enzyme
MPNFEKSIELYVVLSDRCTFSCGHCINSSSPSASGWEPADRDLDILAKEINENPAIEAVNFSGGEPTLFIGFIERLQKQITRPVRYAITTNGGFWPSSNPLLTIQLHDLLLSYDKFHAKFQSKENLVSLIRWATSKNLRVYLNYLFEDLIDLLEADAFAEAGAEVMRSRLITSGRQRHRKAEIDWIDQQSIDQVCPSLRPGANRHGREKVVYMPGRGFTPCCGPLMFDGLQDDAFLFSSSFESYKDGPLRTLLSEGTFGAQAKISKVCITNAAFGSPCGACEFLYSNSTVASRSISDLASQTEETGYYPCSDFLTKQQEETLLVGFDVSYVFTILPARLPLAQDNQKPVSVEVLPIRDIALDEVTDFICKNYYDAFKQYHSENDKATFRATAKEYFAMDMNGTAFLKDGHLVGCVFGHRYPCHPALGEATYHIGYWGYDHDAVSQPEATFIKNQWFQDLMNWTGGDIHIDASISCFNSRALNLMKKLGFRLRSLRLDRRSE